MLELVVLTNFEAVLGKTSHIVFQSLGKLSNVLVLLQSLPAAERVHLEFFTTCVSTGHHLSYKWSKYWRTVTFL